MTELLTLRIQENEKESLSFSSNLSGLPISRIIMPFIDEGVKVTLGAVLLFRIDTNVYKKDRFERFIDLLQQPARKGTSIFPAVGPEEYQDLIPRVIWDFFDLLVEIKGVQRMNAAFEEVELDMDTGYITIDLLRILCFTIGASYISMGGSLSSMNYQLANELFFHRMLNFFYRSNARGTARPLSTQWYSRRELISRLVGEMSDLYNERTGSRVVEAIVVSSPEKRRGRPRKKRKKHALPPVA